MTAPSRAEALAPCPFCGSANLLVYFDLVRCEDCQARGPVNYEGEGIDESKALSAKLWNAQHARAAAIAEVLALDKYSLMEEDGCDTDMALMEDGKYIEVAAIRALPGGAGAQADEGAMDMESCPPDCMLCHGEACNKCGAGCWSNVTNCEHDVIARHEKPECVRP